MNTKNGFIGAILGNLIDGFHWITEFIMNIDLLACVNSFLVSACGAVGYSLVMWLLSKRNEDAK